MKSYLIKLVKNSSQMLYLLAGLYSIPSYFQVKGWSRNTIKWKGAFLKNTKIRILGHQNTIVIEEENRLRNCLLHINGNNNCILIGRHCILNNLELWIEDDGGKISIAYRTTAEGGHIAATEGVSITIGEDCMFSHGIEIRNGDSHAIYQTSSHHRINSSSPIMIGNHVWLGADTKVLKGSIIGDGTVVGTGSIVSGTLDGNSIYVGVSAKKVKENILWKRNRI